jgi:hypothetical protein
MSARKPSAYAPRNALNADALMAGIARRSQARGDSDEAREWLLNHFYRHLVANFEPARRIVTQEDARQALSPSPLPEWVAACFRRAEEGAPLVWIDPDDAQALALEARLVEFLHSRAGTPLEGKLKRVNCPQALALWEKEHAEMARRIARGWRQSNPEAWVERLKTPNGVFVEFLSADARALRAEMAFESYWMRHCLGQFANRQALTGGYGEGYAEAIEQGRLRLFSFRDAGGQPHITLSLIVKPGGKLEVEQVKGKQNRPPVQRYADDLLACLNHLDTEDITPDDCIAIGIAHDGKQWRRVADIVEAEAQLRLVHRHPALLAFFTRSAPAVDWLVAGKAPQRLENRETTSKTLPYVLDAIFPQRRQRSAEPATQEDWPGFQMPAPARPFSDPLSNLKVGGAILLCWLLSTLGAPAALVWGAFLLWFLRGAWNIFHQQDDCFGGQHGFALALALPMVEATEESGFFETETKELTAATREKFRAPFLHYMECRADADDAAARAHFQKTLVATWPAADLHGAAASDAPRPTLAFAICRLAFFLRNAALLGWIDPEIAWYVLLLNAQRARECFADWEDFGRAYLAGRAQWLAQYRADPLGGPCDEKRLQHWRQEGVWKHQPWPPADPAAFWKKGKGMRGFFKRCARVILFILCSFWFLPVNCTGGLILFSPPEKTTSWETPPAPTAAMTEASRFFYVVAERTMGNDTELVPVRLDEREKFQKDYPDARFTLSVAEGESERDAPLQYQHWRYTTTAAQDNASTQEITVRYSANNASSTSIYRVDAFAAITPVRVTYREGGQGGLLVFMLFFSLLTLLLARYARKRWF